MERKQFNMRLTDEDRAKLLRLRELSLEMLGISPSDADLFRLGLRALEKDYAQQAKKGKP